MRFFAAVGALFAGACCASLPKLPAKRTAFPAPRAIRDAVPERSEIWHDAKRNRDVPVKIYGDSGPIVIFSHGIGEDRDSYAFLGRALARHGFRAVHITHAGTDRAVLKRGYRFLYRAVKQKENWVNRPLDVSFVLDKLGAKEAAIAGHSAGAFTAFALAGLRMTDGSLRDPRIKAAVAMSMPRIDGAVAPGGYDAVEIPVLSLTGTCDTSLLYRTFPRHRRIPFEQAHDAYLVTIDRVNHDTFVEGDERVTAITIAFLRAWMMNDADARAWFEESGSAEIGGVRISVERKREAAR
ncbi:MAG TPA: alpha/beta fold hydrolase [Thermoanaerobaculia bacterium]|nr:alpha/beta fold hydrolase [Thermoanaerobaculia bacterium]